MLRGCVCALKDRNPVCLSEESAAVKKRPSSSTTRDPVRRRAADHCRGPGTFYHAMTVIAYISVISPLDGGGLYALRAGRCGCDSLSLAGSRQRVNSLRSSVRLRLVIYTARSILSGIDFGYAFAKSFKGSQNSETVPSVHSVRSSLRHSSHRLAQMYPYRDGLCPAR